MSNTDYHQMPDGDFGHMIDHGRVFRMPPSVVRDSMRQASFIPRHTGLVERQVSDRYKSPFPGDANVNEAGTQDLLTGP